VIRTRTHLAPVAGQPDLIPLINVVFLLLIFFMLSSSMVFQAGIPVELPVAAQPEMRAAEKLIATVTANGLLFFNDKPLDWDDLERELRGVVHDRREVLSRRQPEGAGDGGLLLVLRADRSAPYARVVEIMALARAQNLGVYLVTDPSAPATPRAAVGAAME
jgi:biopolymer transport protein ExbD